MTLTPDFTPVYTGDTLRAVLSSEVPAGAVVKWQYIVNPNSQYFSFINDATGTSYPTKDGDAGRYIRAYVTAPGYSGALTSEHFKVEQRPDITNYGYVGYDSDSKFEFGGTISLISPSAFATIIPVKYQWQRSADGSTNWTDISGATGNNRTATESDVNKYLRVYITADRHSGFIATTPMRISKAACIRSVAEPQLEVQQSGTTFRVVVKQAVQGQEYIVLTTNKQVSSLTESDWSNAVKVESLREDITLTASTPGAINYVYTRVAETAGRLPSTEVKKASIYCGPSTTLQGVELTPSTGATAGNGIYYGSVGNAIKIDVMSIPTNPNFGGLPAAYFKVKRGGVIAPGYGEFYADPECTLVLREYQGTQLLSYRTVYFMLDPEAQDERLLICAIDPQNQRELGNFPLIVGTPRPESVTLSPNEFSVRDGEEAIYTATISVTPANADVSGLRVVYDGMLPPNTKAPAVEVNFATGGFRINAVVTKPYSINLGTNNFKIMSGTTQVGTFSVNVVLTKVTVNFNGNGGSGTMPRDTASVGSEYVLPECGFTAPEGHVFDGWEIGSDVFDAGTGITMDGSVRAITVKARWKQHFHEMDHIPAMAASCETNGNIEHYICTACGKWYSDAEGTQEIADHNSVTLYGYPHSWSEEGVVWEWADDYSWATATFPCTKDPAHTRICNAVITVTRTEPTYERDGSISYRAAAGFIYDELDYGAEDVQTVTLPMLQPLALLDNDSGDLSNEQILMENDGFAGNVKLSGRTLFRNGTWNTLCLPFSLNSLTGTPLEGATVRTLSDASFSNGTLSLTFADAAIIEAGKPYIVKWQTTGGNIADPVFENVTLEPGNPRPLDFIGGQLSFVGSFRRINIEQEDRQLLYMGSDSKLYYPNGPMQINAFRALFYLSDGLTAGNPKSGSSAKGIMNFILDFGDGVVTPVETIEQHDGPAATEGWYTLDGRKLNEKPVQKGIYIFNGRKIVVK